MELKAIQLKHSKLIIQTNFKGDPMSKPITNPAIVEGKEGDVVTKVRDLSDTFPNIETGCPVEVADGILLLRMPLPFALDHINVYLLKETDGWTVIDTGLDTPEAREIWMKVLESPLLCGRPIKRLLVTHHHPDHIGLAGWISRNWDVDLEITKEEFLLSGRYADPNRDPHKERIKFWTENGMPYEMASDLAGSMPSYLRNVHPAA